MSWAEGWPRSVSPPAGAAAARVGSLPPYGGFLVNAAFVLVTSAWLAGQAAAPPPPPAKPPATTVAPAAPAACGSSCGTSCGGDCNTCCDSCGKGGLLGRFRGLFSKRGG